MRKRKAMFAGLAAAVFLFVWEQVQATRLGFELEECRREAVAARDRNAYLRLELSRLTAPGELADVARKRLGMVPPSPESLVLLSAASRRPLAEPADLRPALAAAGASTHRQVAMASHPLRPTLLGWLSSRDTEVH